MTPDLEREIVALLKDIKRSQEHEDARAKALYDLTDQVTLLGQRIDRQQARTDERLAGFDARLQMLERDRATPVPPAPEAAIVSVPPDPARNSKRPLYTDRRAAVTGLIFGIAALLASVAEALSHLAK